FDGFDRNFLPRLSAFLCISPHASVECGSGRGAATSGAARLWRFFAVDQRRHHCWSESSGHSPRGSKWRQARTPGDPGQFSVSGFGGGSRAFAIPEYQPVFLSAGDASTGKTLGIHAVRHLQFECCAGGSAGRGFIRRAISGGGGFRSRFTAEPERFLGELYSGGARDSPASTFYRARPDPSRGDLWTNATGAAAQTSGVAWRWRIIFRHAGRGCGGI